VRAVRRAERIVDIDVRQRSQLGGEARIVFFFFRVEPQVLEQHHTARRRPRHGLSGRIADAVFGEGDRPLEHLREMFGHRLQRKFRHRLPLGPPQVGTQDHHTRAAIQRVLDRRQRRFDPRVFRDPPVLDRNVEVHAHQHAPSLDVDVVDGLFLLQRGYMPFLTSRRSRSTQRLE
jgi:hypothetical protein